MKRNDNNKELRRSNLALAFAEAMMVILYMAIVAGLGFIGWKLFEEFGWRSLLAIGAIALLTLIFYIKESRNE